MAANEALKSLGSLFKSEKAKLQEIHTSLKTDHESFQTSISSQITKLQDELAIESKIKDSLALNTEEVKVLSAKLEALEKQAREAELDEHQRIIREAEEKERVEKEAQATLQSKKLLFPKWTLKRIQNDVVDLPSQYWLEPIVSFDLQNTQDSQLDLPITPIVFRFRAFVKLANVSITDSGADHMMFSFYLKHMKPQYETWSLSKITGVKVTGPIETDSFPNAKFKLARGSARQ
ncbi:unnamed protein product [Lactuca virosa]|uniref:MATH domain-containing protein n=1 Tax=Lactuca virosa TaxID=75947 RepID=A0AAU9LQG2_9ASTR|nr:unnamed protein product [Lactuca virosa]